MTIFRSKRHSAPAFDDLSERTRVVLARNGITSLVELCNLHPFELSRLPGCGSKTCAECDQLLTHAGLMWRVDDPDRIFDKLFDLIEQQLAVDGDYRRLGARYGASASLIYEIHERLSRATKAADSAAIMHDKWKAQEAAL